MVRLWRMAAFPLAAKWKFIRDGSAISCDHAPLPAVSFVFRVDAGASTRQEPQEVLRVLPLETTNFGRELVFSADLCYNEVSEKPPSEREVARVA